MIIPVLLKEDGRKQAVLVHINPFTLVAVLYYVPDENNDNSDISDNVLDILEIAAEVNGVNFNEEEVDGKVHEIETEHPEDMVVYSCYIADCLTFNKKIDHTKSVESMRSKVVDAILSVTQLSGK